VFKFWDWKELFLKQRFDFLDKVGKRLCTLNQSLSSSILILHCKMYTIPIPLPSGEIFRKRVDFPAIFEKETLYIKLTSSGYMKVEGLHTGIGNFLRKLKNVGSKLNIFLNVREKFPDILEKDEYQKWEGCMDGWPVGWEGLVEVWVEGSVEGLGGWLGEGLGGGLDEGFG